MVPTSSGVASRVNQTDGRKYLVSNHSQSLHVSPLDEWGREEENANINDDEGSDAVSVVLFLGWA